MTAKAPLRESRGAHPPARALALVIGGSQPAPNEADAARHSNLRSA